MRTRLLFVSLVLSLAANALLGAAFWSSRRAVARTAQGACAPALSADERAAREDLAALLCQRPPDRARIEQAMLRLDRVRARDREHALAGFLSACDRASGADRAELEHTVRHQLCPWKEPGEGCCAPPPAAGGTHTDPAQPRPSGGAH